MNIFIIGLHLSGMDFDPLGILVASIDGYGMCVISDINTNENSYQARIGMGWSNLFIYSKLLQNELVPIYIDGIRLVNLL